MALLETGIPQAHVGRVTEVCKRVCECVCVHAGVCVCLNVCVARQTRRRGKSPWGTCKAVSRPSIPESLVGSGYSQPGRASRRKPVTTRGLALSLKSPKGKQERHWGGGWGWGLWTEESGPRLRFGGFLGESKELTSEVQARDPVAMGPRRPTPKCLSRAGPR